MDPVTCVSYYDHITSCLCKLITKYYYFSKYIPDFFHH